MHEHCASKERLALQPQPNQCIILLCARIYSYVHHTESDNAKRNSNLWKENIAGLVETGSIVECLSKGQTSRQNSLLDEERFHTKMSANTDNDFHPDPIIVRFG